MPSLLFDIVVLYMISHHISVGSKIFTIGMKFTGFVFSVGFCVVVFYICMYAIPCVVSYASKLGGLTNASLRFGLCVLLCFFLIPLFIFVFCL